MLLGILWVCGEVVGCVGPFVSQDAFYAFLDSEGWKDTGWFNETNNWSKGEKDLTSIYLSPEEELLWR